MPPGIPAWASCCVSQNQVKAVHKVNDKGNYQVKINGLIDEQISELKGYINNQFGLFLD